MFTKKALMHTRIEGVEHTQKRRIGVWVGTLIFYLDRSCVCSVQIPTLTNKTFVDCAYVFKIKEDETKHQALFV
jgi:hypothetical protein